MDKYEIAKTIETFAPLELAESWDCSGWLVETDKIEFSIKAPVAPHRPVNFVR